MSSVDSVYVQFCDFHFSRDNSSTLFYENNTLCVNIPSMKVIVCACRYAHEDAFSKQDIFFTVVSLIGRMYVEVFVYRCSHFLRKINSLRALDIT